MPTAICTNCFEIVPFRNTSGSTMPRTCSDCGQPTLTLAQYREGKWQPVAAAPRTWITCPLCGQRRNATAANSTTQTLAEPATFRLFWEEKTDQIYQTKTLPAGTIICWNHRPEPEALP